MTSAIFICVTLLISTIAVRRPRTGMMALLVATILCPVARIAGAEIRVEHLLVPVLLGVVLVISGELRIPLSFLPLTGWIGCIGIGSLFATGPLQPITLYGFVRPLLLMLLLYQLRWRKDAVVTLAVIFAIASVPVAMLSIGQALQIQPVIDLTRRLYVTNTMPVFDNQLDALLSGYSIFRGLGVFGNVSPNGAFLSAATGVSTLLLTIPGRSTRTGRLLIVTLLISIAGGIATMSGTYLAGTSVALAVISIVSTRHVRAYLCAGTAISVMGFTAFASRSTVFSQFLYQFHRLSSMDISGRYGARQGILADAMRLFSLNPIFGIGASTSSAFLGDSFWITTLVSCGIVGMLFFVIAIIVLLLRARRMGTDGRVFMLLTTVYCTTGLSCTSILATRLGDWWWAFAGCLCAIPIGDNLARVTANRVSASARHAGISDFE